jgi:hypothetical protein
MLAPHVPINTVTARKRLHTHPTNVRLTHYAFYMIASFILLDRNMTTGASLNITLVRPFLEQIVSVFRFRTGKSVVCICLAGWANPHKATWTLQEDTFRSRAKDLRTIGSGTTVKSFRMRFKLDVVKCNRPWQPISADNTSLAAYKKIHSVHFPSLARHVKGKNLFT